MMAPGDNWAEIVGKALQESEFIVFLFTPGAFESDWLRKDVEYALGSKKYEGRVFSVFVGPTLEAEKEMPWILRKLPHIQIGSAKELGKVVKAIESQIAASEESPAHA